MEPTNDLFDEIDAFLDNRMPPVQRQSFQQRIAQDTELQQEITTQRLLRQGVQAAALKGQLATLRRGVARQRLNQRVVRMAAVLLLVGGLVTAFFYTYQQIQTLTPQQAFAAYYAPEPRARDDELLPAGLPEARAAYYAGQYELAFSRLVPLQTDSLRLVPYYRGLTLLALTRLPAATEALRLAQQSPDLTTRQQADRYLALTYLRANNLTEARRVLTQIQNDTTHPYHEKAAELLEKLH